MSPELPRLLDYALALAREAGTHTARHFGKPIEVETKSDLSPVTVADRETEELCRRRIAGDWPDHGILGEEFGTVPDRGSGFQWVIDPIDGTKSFISGLPLYTVLLALLKDGKPILGIIHQPILDETVWAGVGLGAYYNGSPTWLRQQADLSKAWLMCTDPTHLLHEYPSAGLELFNSESIIRSWGDGYCYLLVASGRADIMNDPRMNLWDLACLKPIIEEAGGIFSDLEGNPGLGSSCLVANPSLHPTVLRLFRK